MTINTARNHLEHVDERVVKASSLAPPLDQVYLMNNKRRVYVFGTKIDFGESGFKKIGTLRKDIERWYAKLPTIFDKFEERYGSTLTR